MVEKMGPTICRGSFYALPPAFSKHKLSFATLSVRNLYQASLYARGEMLSDIGCEKWANLLCIIEAQSTMRSSKGATWLPLSSIYLKVTKKNIKWQKLSGSWEWLGNSKHLHLCFQKCIYGQHSVWHSSPISLLGKHVCSWELSQIRRHWSLKSILVNCILDLRQTELIIWAGKAF